MKKRKKIGTFFLIVGIVLVLFAATFIPLLSLKTKNMNVLEGEYVTVYYEKEEAAARDVFALANTESELIANALGFRSPQDINVYIYDFQSTFQTKKYGLIALVLNLDWYICDNRGKDVLLTSPANPGEVHDYDNNKFAAIHEMVHAYNSILNANMSLWINEGLRQTHTSNPVTFSNMGGYDFAHTYIEFLDKTFGWDNVLLLAKTNDYMKAFGKSETVVYEDWINFLRANYS